jgi:hypothetical protein
VKYKQNKEKLEELFSKVTALGSNRIWSMSENNAEYQRNKRLIESKHLSLNFFNDALYEKAEERLVENDKAGKWEQKRFIAVIDGSEIRKKHSSDSEYLQKVRSLDGELVNGYRSTGTVLLAEDNSEVILFEQDVFSSKEKGYLSDNDKAIKAIEKVVKLNKKLKNKVTFVLDRFYDTFEFMSFLQSKKQEFIVRVSHKNRKVNYLTKPIKTNLPLSKEKKEELLTPKVKICDIAAFPIKKEFSCKYDSVKLKKGTYKNVTTKYYHYEVMIDNINPITGVIANISGTVIEVKMRSGTNPKNIYADSLLLFTNKVNLSEDDIKDVFFRYLQRFGIEQVYRFMKTTLNLEKFQARDFENIKKIIALTFFAAAWFYFTKKEVLENPVLEKRIYHLCQLGRGKKQIGPLYLQQGLESLMSHFLVSKWQKEYEISDQELREIMEYFGYGWVFRK